MIRFLLFIVLLCTFTIGAYSQQTTSQDEHKSDGKASYYSKSFQGRKTANGEKFNNYDYTAAHRSFPFNTYLNVVNKDNGYNVIVRVNDRGPFAKNRVIDLSEAAARRIGGYKHGLIYVRIDVLDILNLTPELEHTYLAAPLVDCLGNVPDELKGVSLSLWSTFDLLHAIYIANDLYLKEPVDKVYIGNKMVSGKRKYYVIISNIANKAAALAIKDKYERKGFMRVNFYNP